MEESRDRSLGIAERRAGHPDGVIDNHEVLWPETEGREGLEQTFNQVLTGKHGEYKITFDQDGRKTSEKIVTPPVPGHTVVTTLDLHLQELAEKALEAKAKRGRSSSSIRTMAIFSRWPPGLPMIRTHLRPTISTEKFKALQDDPNIPLLPRAFRSSYPPGSTFKVAVGIAALESRTVRSDDEFDCMPALQVGNTVFHNWKKDGSGFAEFRPGADRIVRHLVLSGRNQDGGGSDS